MPQKKKPIILSTGASSLEEIKYSVNILKRNGCKNLTLMHCVLNYPTKNINANLNMIDDLKKNFPKCTIGYSDHTVPDKNMIILVSAYLKGAMVIEKHFTFDKKIKGNDHYHSMDKNDLKVFVSNLEIIHSTSGLKKKKYLNSEKISRKNARRSIVLKTDVFKGQVLKKEMLITKRPGTGIKPTEWYNVIGKRTKKNLKKDRLLLWSDLK